MDFTAVVEDDVVESRGAPGKPRLADDLDKLIKGEKIAELIGKGQKSKWYLIGEETDTKIRAAAKYHGYSVNFGKTKDGKAVFRFAGKFVPMSQEDKNKRIKAAADNKAKKEAAAKAA